MMVPSRLAAAILPLAGLAMLWGWSDRESQQGTIWQVPIAGYDPRDFLRGHYVEFRYDWPGLPDDWEGGPIARLCLEGTAPVIDRAALVADEAGLAACDHPVRIPPGGVYGADGLRQGRLYVGQERARMLDAELRRADQRAIADILLRKDGTITVRDITFRALSPAERAARNGQDDQQDGAAPPAGAAPAIPVSSADQ